MGSQWKGALAHARAQQLGRRAKLAVAAAAAAAGVGMLVCNVRARGGLQRIAASIGRPAPGVGLWAAPAHRHPQLRTILFRMAPG
eukprot:116919-Chlamydomonas_euryale.AAC.2